MTDGIVLVTEDAVATACHETQEATLTNGDGEMKMMVVYDEDGSMDQGVGISVVQTAPQACFAFFTWEELQMLIHAYNQLDDSRNITLTIE